MRERENEREEREVESMGNEIPAKRFSFKEFLSDLQQKRKILNFLVLSYFFTSISQLCMHSCTCTHTCTHTGTHTCTHTGTTTSMHSCESKHTHTNEQKVWYFGSKRPEIISQCKLDFFYISFLFNNLNKN